MKIDPATLTQLLHYEPSTGKLWWLVRESRWFISSNPSRICNAWNARYANREALTAVSTTGYHYGNIFGEKHFAARVAFALMTGQYPEIIDHIDGNKLNDAWENLREANASENARNVASAKNSTSKFLGVSWTNRGGKNWYACITVDGRTVSLGRHYDEVDAAKAYDRAAFIHYGEFARLNFPGLAG